MINTPHVRLAFGPFLHVRLFLTFFFFFFARLEKTFPSGLFMRTSPCEGRFRSRTHFLFSISFSPGLFI